MKRVGMGMAGWVMGGACVSGVEWTRVLRRKEHRQCGGGPMRLPVYPGGWPLVRQQEPPGCLNRGALGCCCCYIFQVWLGCRPPLLVSIATHHTYFNVSMRTHAHTQYALTHIHKPTHPHTHPHTTHTKHTCTYCTRVHSQARETYISFLTLCNTNQSTHAPSPLHFTLAAAPQALHRCLLSLLQPTLPLAKHLCQMWPHSYCTLPPTPPPYP